MSEQFVVSARKYRPQRFDEVVGQEATTQTLKNAIKNHQLAHSFLFCGSRGIGKTTIARIFAKTINCKNLQPDGEACNECDSCVAFNKNASFNVIELDAASRNSVEEIRELIEQVQYAPQNAEYKIFIIDEVHMLSQAAFNAFLKTLEEPPAYAKFILATTEKHKILPTILSRCQIYDFKRIGVEDIQNHLAKIAQKEGVEADMNALNLIAQKADGGLRDALSMFDRLVSMSGRNLEYQQVLKSLNILDHAVFSQFIEAIVNEESDKLLLLLNDVLANGFDLDAFLSGFAEHIRHIWVAKRDNTMVLLDFSPDIKNQFVAQGKLLDEASLLNILQIISECEVLLKTTRNRRLAVEIALIKMSYLKRLMNTSWTELGEKKKSNPVVSQTKEEKNILISSTPAHSTPPTQNKGLELGDLLKRYQAADPTEKQAKPELAPITDNNIWTTIIEKYEDNSADLQLLRSLHPAIIGDTFLFEVESETMGKILSALFPKLQKIYTELSGNLAQWKFNIQPKDKSIDLTKKEAFDELATRYPILHQIHDAFKLDFNT